MLLLQVLSPSSGMLDYAVSLRPDYHRAILDTVRYYGWTNIIYMYDSHDGMFTYYHYYYFKIIIEILL